MQNKPFNTNARATASAGTRAPSHTAKQHHRIWLEDPARYQINYGCCAETRKGPRTPLHAGKLKLHERQQLRDGSLLMDGFALHLGCDSVVIFLELVRPRLSLIHRRFGGSTPHSCWTPYSHSPRAFPLALRSQVQRDLVHVVGRSSSSALCMAKCMLATAGSGQLCTSAQYDTPSHRPSQAQCHRVCFV